MKRSAKILVHIQLTTSTFTPEERGRLLSAITQNAPSSDLYKNEPIVQAAVTQLAALKAELEKANTAVAATEGLLEAQKYARLSACAAADRCLLLLKGLVENVATIPDQVLAVGFAVRDPSSRGDMLRAPEGVVVKVGRAHGRFMVTAYDLLRRSMFAVQISANPIGPESWKDLPGSGKRRKLQGYASGTVVWVRFAALRGQLRGAWGTPVSVNVP